jgi:hypothetical protein
MPGATAFGQRAGVVRRTPTRRGRHASSLRYARLLLSSFSRSNIKIEIPRSQAENVGRVTENQPSNSGRGRLLALK